MRWLVAKSLQMQLKPIHGGWDVKIHGCNLRMLLACGGLKKWLGGFCGPQSIQILSCNSTPYSCPVGIVSEKTKTGKQDLCYLFLIQLPLPMAHNALLSEPIITAVMSLPSTASWTKDDLDVTLQVSVINIMRDVLNQCQSDRNVH